jgi:hypothetical protein
MDKARPCQAEKHFKATKYRLFIAQKWLKTYLESTIDKMGVFW